MKGQFASDNFAGVSPEVLQAIADSNSAKYVVPYGNDPLSKEAVEAVAIEVLGAKRWEKEDDDELVTEGGASSSNSTSPDDGDFVYRGPKVEINVLGTPGLASKAVAAGADLVGGVGEGEMLRPVNEDVDCKSIEGGSGDLDSTKVSDDSQCGLGPLLKRRKKGQCGLGINLGTHNSVRFHPKDHVLLCFGGTGANCVALGGLLEFPHEYVVCADWAHINTDESGAPERLVGCKIEEVITTDGKLVRTVASNSQSGSCLKAQGDADKLIKPLPHFVEKITKKGKAGFLHRPQPRVVAITQPTEFGAVYTREEIKFLADLCHAHGLYLHMDGARIPNASVALDQHYSLKHGKPIRESSLYENTFELGVDSLSLGLTKNGGMGLEAVIMRPGLFRERYHGDRVMESRRLHFLQHFRKQLGQLNSKMRFMAAQYPVMLLKGRLQDDPNAKLWYRNAATANSVVIRLQDGFRALNKGIAKRIGGDNTEGMINGVLSPLQKQLYLFAFPGDGVDWSENSDSSGTLTSKSTESNNKLLANTIFITIPDARILKRMAEKQWLLFGWQAPESPIQISASESNIGDGEKGRGPDAEGRQQLRFVGSFMAGNAEMEEFFETMREVVMEVLFGKV